MKIAIISPKNRTLYNFRGDLIKEFIKKGHTVIATGPNSIELDKIIELGVQFVEIPMRKNGLNVLEDIRYFRSLISLFQREKPDIVLSYTIKPVVYGALAAKRAKIQRIVSLITGAGYIFTSSSIKAKVLSFFVKILYRKALSVSHTVIFQNEDDQADFIQHKLVNSEKCSIVSGSGVNMKHFQPTPFPEKLTFFMLSRIMKSKGVWEYIQAARIVKMQFPFIRFMLLGAFENIQDSIPREQIQSFIDNGTIEYFGETEDVRDYYSQSSVYVLPSYREGTPRTVLEAMATGRPIITTDSPGCRQTVIEGKTGFLVPIKDEQSLAAKMICFIQNPNMIQTMGSNSLAYCHEKFDVKLINQDMMQYIGIA